MAAGEETKKKTKMVAIIFRILHMGLSVFMCVTAVDSLSRDNDISETDSIFVAAYVFLFAVILFFFELTQFKSIPKLDKAYKANFGFLYKPISKGIFLIFVGFLQFGLDASQILIYSCGILTIVDGILLMLVYCKEPTLLVDGPPTYTPPAQPTSSSTTARSQEV